MKKKMRFFLEFALQLLVFSAILNGSDIMGTIVVRATVDLAIYI